MTGSNPAYDILPPVKAEKQRKKRKSGAFGIFKAALYMLRKRNDEKKEKSSGGGGEWKKIVHSMRPLHVQEMPASPRVHAFGAESPAASSSGTMSQYASANNLRDLCREDEVFDAIEGDEMIDAKAEEFIARFYKSIHHQNSIHRQDRGV
ncbi:uncharacterized protein LOC125221316 [Salvia hispanica]|uniref:uncharacterized protein LOC125221316 n=1 Tax=Salvia hispanica TaxID=49212 RepID=UPI0020097FF0|nr:uncharacterized protein LOC125221316 [Salvia hispanica]